MDNKTKDALKQLQSDVRQLQTIVAARYPSARVEPPGLDEPAGIRKGKEAVVQCAVTHCIPGAGPEPKKMVTAVTASQLARVTNEDAAALGYAVASPQKVGLLRALLDKTSESASALGELTGLSTGSLYHHLRELMRANLIHQAGRNSYVLTERGTRVLLVLLALASD